MVASTEPLFESGRPEREPLSEDEIRALLGGDESSPEVDPEVLSLRDRNTPQERDTVRDRPTRVLLVSRHEEETRMLLGVLEGLQIETSVVKNPFGALDRLRQRRYDWVISDFDLWANHGQLLHQRLAQSGASTRVVFICAGGETAQLARRAGAAQVLCRPVDLHDVARALTFSRPAGEVTSEELTPAEITPEEAEGEEEVRDLVQGSGGKGFGGKAVETPAARPALTREVRWLRFFFEARKALREKEPRRFPLETVLAAFTRQLGPSSCGVGIRLEEGWWIRIQPGSERILQSLGLALGQERALEPPSRHELRVPFSAGGRPAVFAAIWSDPVDMVPEKFTVELVALFGEINCLPG